MEEITFFEFSEDISEYFLEKIFKMCCSLEAGKLCTVANISLSDNIIFSQSGGIL